MPIYSTTQNTSEAKQETYLCLNNTGRMLYYYPRNKDIAEKRILHTAPGIHFPIHTTNTQHIFLSIHPTKHKTSLESIHIPKNCTSNALGQIKLTINTDQHHDIFATAS